MFSPSRSWLRAIFACPEHQARFWKGAEFTAEMAMSEAAINENDLLSPRKVNIEAARQSFIVRTIPVTH